MEARMRINQDTGEVMITESEMMDVSVADDDLNAIESIICDLNSALIRIQKLKNNGTIEADQKALFYAQECMQDVVDDVFTKSWGKLCKKAHRTHDPLPKLTAIRGGIE
jgi:hypothetical protein